MLREGQWEELSSALKNGLSPAQMVNGFPLFVAILQAAHHQHQEHHQRQQHDYRPVVMAPSLRAHLVNLQWPDVLHVHEGKQKTAVSWACFYGHLDLALDLIKKGHKIDTLDWPIWDAMIEGLLTRGPMINKNVRTKGQDYLEIVVLDKEKLDQVNWFLLSDLIGAVKNDCSKWPGKNLEQEHHNHVLSSMIIAGHLPLIRSLVQHGVDPDCLLYFEDSDGQIKPSTTRACEIAVEMQHDDILKVLMEHGARWGASGSKNDYSLLDVCAMVGHEQSLEYVLRHCPVRQLCHDLPDAMLNAVAYGNLDVVKRLHEAGAPVRLKTPSGFTLMHQAALGGHLDVIFWLHQNGADWNDPSSSGLLPMDLLAQHHPKLSKTFTLQEVCSIDEEAPSSNILTFPRRR